MNYVSICKLPKSLKIGKLFCPTQYNGGNYLFGINVHPFK